MRANEQRSRNMQMVRTLIISFILALIVWLIAINQENPLIQQEYPRPIQIQIRGMGDKMQILQDLTNRTVDLTLRAPQRTLESLQAGDFSAVIDLTNLPPGSHEIPVTIIALNPDVEIVDHQPQNLRIQLDQVITKTMPVQHEVIDTPAFGYTWQTPVIEPAQVEVRGPQTQVEQVRSVIAEIFLNNAKRPVERTRPLIPRDAQDVKVPLVQIEPPTAKITVPVAQRPDYKEVVVRVQREGVPASNYWLTGVTAEPSTIVLQGSPDALREIPGTIETPPLSIEGATRDVQARVQAGFLLNLPENVSILGEDSVLVTVKVAPVVSSRTVLLTPIVHGLGDNMSYTISPERVEVIVSGPVPLLNSLGPEDVRVTLDLTGRLPDSHVIQPMVHTPEGTDAEETNPKTVEVLIEPLSTPTPTALPIPTGAATPQPLPTTTDTSFD